MVLNNQKAERQIARSDGLVEVQCIWDTIQGEGPFAGTPAVFVRLAGCNLECPFCDTDYTSDRRMVSPQSVLKQVRELRSSRALVVLTGGEPYRQNIGLLVEALVAGNYRVQIETNGILFQPLHGAEVVVSPKTPKVHRRIWDVAKSAKYVLEAEHIAQDGLPMETLGNSTPVARPPVGWPGTVYAQPLDVGDSEANAANTAATVRACLEHGHRLCLQMHKIVGVP